MTADPLTIEETCMLTKEDAIRWRVTHLLIIDPTFC